MTIYRNEIVLSSTHVDLQGDQMTKEALEGAAETINSGRRPRLGLEHDMTFPPMGRISEAEVIQGEDGEYYLVAYQEYFDQRAKLTLLDGTVLLQESFTTGGTPFAEVKFETPEQLEVYIDRTNFSSQDDIKAFFQQIKDDTSLEFQKKLLSRKSVLPDPEVVITLTQLYIIYFFGKKLLPKVEDKVAEKVSEKISDDIAGLYDLIKGAVKGMIKYAIPKNRPIIYIIEAPADIHIELIIKTAKPEEVETSVSQNNLDNLKDRIEHLQTNFRAEKIQFIWNNNKQWELNYLLTATGETIGRKQSFDKRDNAFKELAEKMLQRKTKDDEHDIQNKKE